MSGSANGTKPIGARPYFLFDAQWWRVTTAGMQIEEKGAYIELLHLAWHQEPAGTLPDDDRQLARMAGVTPEQWAEIAPIVRQQFTKHPQKRIASPKLLEQFRQMCGEHARNVEAGKQGAKVRWGKR